jgi:outer membrane protein assembly factor BamB
MMFRRASLRSDAARCALTLIIGASLSSCAGFKTPSFFGLNKGGKDKQRATEGQRIPVLGSAEKISASPALKGVDFSVPPPQTIAAWPSPGGDAEQSVENVELAKGFSIAWRHKIGLGTGRRDHIVAPPIAAENHIFTLDGEGTVEALDESGHQIWTTTFRPKSGKDREAFGGGLAYADGTLFIASGYRFIAAMDAKTGKVKWRYETTSPIHGAPNVADGKVFVVDVTDQLIALDAATGQQAWTYQGLEEPARMLEASSPAVAGTVVVAPFASGELIGLSTANGNQLWQDVLSLTNRNNALSEIRDIAGRPVIYRGIVYAGSHAGVFAAIDINSGQRVWSLPITTITTPWPAGDVVYVTDQSGELVCISRDSGQIYWIKNLNDTILKNYKKGKPKPVKKRIKAVWSSPVLASNHIVVVSDQGEALEFDDKTGALQARLKLGSPAFLSPISMNGTLYELTNTGELLAIR